MVIVSILVTWGVLALLFSGLGLLTACLLREDSPELTRTFWLGWAGTLVFLLFWCLVAPINNACCLAVAGLAVLGFVVGQRRGWFERLRSQAIWMLPLAPIAWWMADLARQAPGNGDSRMYHLPAVAWAEAFPVVPGLANLHGRLGFNNSTTLYQALIDHGPWAERGYHVAHGLLLLPLYAQGLRALRRLATTSFSARDGLDAMLLAFAVDATVGPNLTSASPDLPAGVLECVIASELVALNSARARSLALLCGVLLTVKLSALGFVAGVIAVVLLFRRRTLLSPAASFSLPLVPWLVRGVILSGYPVYPSTLGGLPLDWRVPTGRAIEETNIILAWGRRPGVPWEKVLGNWDWLGPWWRSMILLNREVLLPVALGTLLAVSAVVLRRRGALWCLFVPLLLEFAWWFAGSPDPRFAGATFWLLPAVAAAILLPLGARVVTVLSAGLLLWTVAFEPSARPPPGRSLVPAGVTMSEEHRTDSGLEVWIPKASAFCWPAPLVCTPELHSDLRLRRAGDLSAGFAPARQ